MSEFGNGDVFASVLSVSDPRSRVNLGVSRLASWFRRSPH